jgi:iron complex transport system substrate-binding protein
LQLLNTREKVFRPQWESFRRRSRRQPVAFAQQKGDGILLFQLRNKRNRVCRKNELLIRLGAFSARSLRSLRLCGEYSGNEPHLRDAEFAEASQRKAFSNKRDQRTTSACAAFRLTPLPLIMMAAIALTACSKRLASTPSSSNDATREVVDEAGRRVLLPLRIERVVSLAPNLTEIVYVVGAGNRLVGDTEYCYYPPEAKNIAKIGDTMHPSIERIIALKPQIVLVSTASQLEAFTKQLGEQKIAVYVTNPHTLEEIFRSIATLGDLFGEHERAEGVVADLRKRASAIGEAVKQVTPVKVFYQVSGEPLYTIGRESYLTDLVRRAGGVSVTADVPGAFPRFSDEAALAAHPEAIILPTGGSMGSANSDVAKPLKNSPAVLNNRVYKINDDHLSRPGPRLIEGLEAMAHALHPEVFK